MSEQIDSGELDPINLNSFDEVPPEVLPPPALEFWPPSQFMNWQPPDGFILAGDAHLVRGACAVVGGAPGVGKSRASMALAIAGATGAHWFNVPIRSQFRSVIIQSENGPYRLKRELEGITLPTRVNLDEWMRISPPPPHGMQFGLKEFRDQLNTLIEDFQPGLLVVDPWNAAIEGDADYRDYKVTLNSIFAALPAQVERRPAVLIVHHLRKSPAGQGSKRKRGRELLSELAGSYGIGAFARTVWVLEAYSNDPGDNRVILTNCKANDAEELPTTAWCRRNGLFIPVEDFDADTFYAAATSNERGGITLQEMDEIFRGFDGTRKQAVDLLQERADKRKTTAYQYLKEFADHFEECQDGKLRWKAAV